MNQAKVEEKAKPEPEKAQPDSGKGKEILDEE